jgi:hypothetical protein
VLDTRSASAFGNGTYLVWTLGGHVTVKITNTNLSPNAVLSGLFFGGAGSTGTGGTGTATFVKTDSTTAGSWKGVYGVDGYNVFNDGTSYPSYVAVTSSGYSPYIWASSTSDTRGLQKAVSTTDRIAACWFTGVSLSVSLAFNDSQTHQVGLYLLDWDHGGRTERVDVLDSNGTVLDTRSASAFGSGQYLVWTLGGHVTVRVTNTNGASNAVVSGLFFGGTSGTGGGSGTATFLKTDSTTAGSWKGVYGTDGYSVINDSTSYPSYVAVTPTGFSAYSWAPSTSDTRGLQKVISTTDRIAACWFTVGSLSIDLAFNDSQTHQVGLYLLDWDHGGRTERVDVLDANGNVLDTRSASAFGNGQYLVWTLGGHVTLKITNTALSPNAVVSGLFFGGAAGAGGTATH